VTTFKKRRKAGGIRGKRRRRVFKAYEILELTYAEGGKTRKICQAWQGGRNLGTPQGRDKMEKPRSAKGSQVRKNPRVGMLGASK